MGNFKSQSKQINKRTNAARERSILRGTVGPDGENLHADLRLISTALSQAGLVSPQATLEEVKRTIFKAVRHIHRTTKPKDPVGPFDLGIFPADDTERAMRRAISELRFPTAHRAIALSAAPKGARAIVECGMSIARKKLHQGAHIEDTPAPFRRALLPPLLPQVSQSNRCLAATLAKFDIDGLDTLIAANIIENGKAGFIEIRDFFTVLSITKPEKALNLGAKVKRRLRGKPRRRFIKLIRNVPPNEDDFNDRAS
ncbi:hypothetical protein N9L49_00035 [Rhodospirillales bacterium]|nr:hypothetical protein [Rhodospirillales bacterium]